MHERCTFILAHNDLGCMKIYLKYCSLIREDNKDFENHFEDSEKEEQKRKKKGKGFQKK